MGPHDIPMADWKEIKSFKIARGTSGMTNLPAVVSVLRFLAPVCRYGSSG